MYQTFSIYTVVDGHLDTLPFLTIVDRVAMHIEVHELFL